MNYYNQETHPDQKYFLTEESVDILEGVHPALIEVVKRALAISDIEFQVFHGKRTLSQQDEFFRKGATQGHQSPHMYGSAVDLMPIVEGRMCPETEVFDEVATSMKYAAADLNTPIRWGGAWHCVNIAKYEGMLDDLQNWYLENCLENNVRPQLDPHHFELSVEE
tara:strand:+ start:4385 stop:4879 length:495 start_codon:yes stop_codon:yes gene_type:complete